MKRADRSINDLWTVWTDRRNGLIGNKVSNKKRRFLFYEDRCVEEWIRDRWVCCLFGSGARSCVKMKGETRATWPDEKTRKTNEEWAAPEKKETVSNGRIPSRKSKRIGIPFFFFSFEISKIWIGESHPWKSTEIILLSEKYAMDNII